MHSLQTFSKAKKNKMLTQKNKKGQTRIFTNCLDKLRLCKEDFQD